MNNELKKTLGLSAALSTVIGVVIGSGVFFKPQAIYTAITRARENMYIINIGNNSYHNFFYNQSL